MGDSRWITVDRFARENGLDPEQVDTEGLDRGREFVSITVVVYRRIDLDRRLGLSAKTPYGVACPRCGVARGKLCKDGHRTVNQHSERYKEWRSR